MTSPTSTYTRNGNGSGGGGGGGGSVTPANVSSALSIYNVAAYGATGNGTTDDTSAINTAITAAGIKGGVVYFPPGNYKISSALSLTSNVTLQGSGAQTTFVTQSTANANGVTLSSVSANVTRPAISSMQFTGTGAGTGVGIFAAAPGNNNAIVSMVMRDLVIFNWGSWGISIDSLDFSELDNVVSTSNGQGTVSGGFHFSGTATGSAGCTMRNCYASSNKGRGYYLSDPNYWSLIGCSCDLNYLGYEITSTGVGGFGVSLSGCGCESTTAAGGLDGTGYKISGSTKGVTLSGCLNVVNNAVSFWATDTSAHTTFVGCVDLSPGGSATASFKADVSTSTYIISPTNTTAMSLSGTYSILSDALSLIRSANMVGINSFGQIDVTEVGAGYSTAEGSNAKQGTATLSAGAVTVSNTAVTTTSRIFLTAQTSGAAPGALRVSARTAGTSFTITSTSGTDTSVVAYEIFEVG